MSTENGKTERPAAIVLNKFRVKAGGTTVTMGISPKTGTLCVYAYEDATGYHSLGRFPAAKFASQWKVYAAVGPAVMGYLAKDEQDTTSPRKVGDEWVRVALKPEGASAKISTSTIEIDSTDSLVQMLVAQGMSKEQAETLASAAE